jgi:hypothetical protein
MSKENKIIAEFMGWNINNPSTFPISLHQEEETQGNWELKFHSDWNWLMEVVSKVFEKEDFIKDDLIFKLNDALLECNKDSLYLAVFNCVNWYNNQKN